MCAFLVFGFAFLFVWLITGCCGFGVGGGFWVRVVRVGGCLGCVRVGVGVCLGGWCGGGLARVFCRVCLWGWVVCAGWLGACLVFRGRGGGLARVFAVCVWVCVCFVGLVWCVGVLAWFVLVLLGC